MSIYLKSLVSWPKAFYLALSDIEIKVVNLHPQYVVDNFSTLLFQSKSSVNLQLRDEYNTKVTNLIKKYIPIFISIHDKDRCFGEDLATEVVQARDEVKHEMQAQSPFISRFFIYVRNLDKYNNASGPSQDSHIKDLAENPEKVGYKALITGGADLGLKNNGFNVSYQKWEDNNFTGPYPEYYMNNIANVSNNESYMSVIGALFEDEHYMNNIANVSNNESYINTVGDLSAEDL